MSTVFSLKAHLHWESYFENSYLFEIRFLLWLRQYVLSASQNLQSFRSVLNIQPIGDEPFFVVYLKLWSIYVMWWISFYLFCLYAYYIELFLFYFVSILRQMGQWRIRTFVFHHPWYDKHKERWKCHCGNQLDRCCW